MPFYGFSQVTGRLKNSTNIQPLYPLKPETYKGEAPQPVWDSIKTKPITTNTMNNTVASSSAPGAAGSASMSTKPKSGKPPTLPNHLYESMKKFQATYGEVPVYIAGGTRDKILFGVTVAGVCIGLIGVVDFVARNINKK